MTRPPRGPSSGLALLLLVAGCSSATLDKNDSSAVSSLSETSRDYSEPPPGDSPVEEPTCDEETPVVLFISPDDSNSMSSPVQVREAVLDGWAYLERLPVRTYEFLNYYTFDYPAPSAGTLGLEAAMVAQDDGSYALQVALVSEALSNEERAPMNLTLSFDTSGSMSGVPLTLAKETARAIASSLRDGDVVSVAGWAEEDYVLLSGHPVSGPDDADLLAAIDSLSASGSTNFSSGLATAYTLAEANRDEGRINRVVLVSDGGANVGVTDEELIGGYAADNDRDGIYLVGVGVGSAITYNDTLMDVATDLGRGASVFVADEEEAWRIFGERFVSTLDVAWRNVSIELDLPPGFEIVRFSGEEYSSDPREIEPQHLAPDDAMVFFLTLETCAPEGVGDASEIGVVVTYTDPISGVEQTSRLDRTFGELQAVDTHLLDKGAAVYAYATGLLEWQMATSEAERQQAITLATGKVNTAMLSNPADGDLEEIAAVLAAME